MRKENGFTLTELLIVVVVAGILAALAAPNLAVFLQNNARATRINSLVTALNYARSEAVRVGNTVTVCASGDPENADFAGCNDGSESNQFHFGWIVFSDVDGDGTVDTGTDTVLRRFSPDIDIAGGTTFVGLRPNPDWATTAVLNSVSFDLRGFATQTTTNFTFIYCDSRGLSQARAVILGTTGHPRTSDTFGPTSCTG